MSSVSLHGIGKSFGGTRVISSLDLEIGEGEVAALLGPSGSGKTTLLRIIAGFESPDAGRVMLAGSDVTARDALERRCGMVFQHYALFPHLDVAGNVGYGLDRLRSDRAAHAERIADALAMVDLTGFERRSIGSLSGGQQQRVALARAIAPRPEVLLLDEPLSNLDPSLRERTRRELGELVRNIGMTTVLVTHEQDTAFDVADRVALLLDGHLAQFGTPADLYHRPASAAVAQFIGRGTTVAGTASENAVSALGLSFAVDSCPAGQVQIMLRPEALELADAGVPALVEEVRFGGARDLILLRVEDVTVEIEAAHGNALRGELVNIRPTGRGVSVFKRSAG